MAKFHLVLLIHGHQPVGNFDDVFEHVYQRSYLPFVECLARHPRVHLGLHYTGPLLEWFEQRHPEFFEQLRGLVVRRQVELVGGGFYEPILVSIPPEDQVEQIVRMRNYLSRSLGVQATGAWLAERVWEPQLPCALASAGVQYTLVDEVHFQSAGFELDELHGDYVCEDRGRTVRVLPGLKQLRYLLPFRSVDDTLTFLRESAARHPGGMAAMGDDCEKFGAWPSTYDHCYRDGWLDRFFSALEANEDWLSSTTPGEYVATHTPLGRADLPTASYSEMMEWVLPTAARLEYQAVGHEMALRPNVMRFLRGGQWRGFFSKYSESNLLNKKMIYVSQRVRELESRELAEDHQAMLADARTRVLRAQCNDAFWHGVFGGLYSPHLRTELWRELVRAETIVHDVAGRKAGIQIEQLDFDADGLPELYVTSRNMAALVKPDDGGTLAALDFRPTGVTLINSIQRRLEAYHGKLREASQSASGAGHVASIHDRVRSKEDGLERFLHYDRWSRNAFRVLLFPKEKSFQDYQELRLEEHAALAAGTYSAVEDGTGAIRLECETALSSSPGNGGLREMVRCSKKFSFTETADGYRIACTIELHSAKAQTHRAQLGIELVINLLAPDAPDRYFETHAGRHELRWAAALPVSGLSSGQVRMVDEWQNVAAVIGAPTARQLWIAPIETVSESEDGFERVYQGSQILAVWPLELTATSRWRGELTLEVKPAHR